ncbi:hypothetical protein [Parasitella parasitica]|uniref:Uncharacterized protein n=1 Tax=Parasitella parasitica TaxID=35722 RepID=A0A0B7N9W7_9FUNG|nr:hypothetical protein [Parasitella parasitica]
MKVKGTRRSNDQTHRGPGRPKKAVIIDAVEEGEASTSATTAPIALRSTEVSEAYDELCAAVRPTTALAYKLPLAHWETYCKENFEGPKVYTVGPPSKVITFFHEFVLLRIYTRRIRIGADTRTQIG